MTKIARSKIHTCQTVVDDVIERHISYVSAEPSWAVRPAFAAA